MENVSTATAPLEPPVADGDWTFAGANTRQLTHCYHDYPARMIPQIAGKLLDRFGPKRGAMFDPYCGSGTTLVEGMIRDHRVVGADLNPLARLISETKTTHIPFKDLDRALDRFASLELTTGDRAFAPAGLRDLEFWFQPQVIEALCAVRAFMATVTPRSVRHFFEVAFSETVRECSNTRNDEFKLYRLPAGRLAQFAPDVRATMLRKLARNRAGVTDLMSHFDRMGGAPNTLVVDWNTVTTSPARLFSREVIDIVVTSPPYGDSRTTVAYGQYSRLSAEWLGLSEPHRTDLLLMGGEASTAELPSDQLTHAIEQIRDTSPSRSREITAFYADLWHSIGNIAPCIRPGGHACYVVGNRRVKGVELPTDVAVADFFRAHGFRHVDTFHRTIPNKRMPLRNSPGNVAGETAATMSREYIVVMRK
jgi:hypothetical protein